MSTKSYLKAYFFASLVLCLMFQGCNPEENKSASAPGFTPEELPSKEERGRPTAPDFTLQDLAGNEVSLRQYKGKIVLLDFWATWCTPCRKSIPELVDVQEKYRDQGLVILGISADDPRRTSDKSLLGFKERYKINYSILRADYGVTLDYFGTSNMRLPTLFVIDREGKVVGSIVGYDPGAAERSVKKLL